MFEHSKSFSAFGSTLEQDEVPAPEGHALSPELTSELSSIPIRMELPAWEVLTPWAIKESDFNWKDIESAPSENIKTYLMTVAQVRGAFEKLFGQPIPYLAIVTKEQTPQAQMDSALDGTDYELQETLAVYAQSDKSLVPAVRYLHWIGLREAGGKRARSLTDALKDLQGQLTFAARVPYADTASRAFPASSFDEAMDTDFTEISEDDIRTFENPDVAPTETKAAVAPQQPSLVGPVMVGVAALALTVYLGKALKK